MLKHHVNIATGKTGRCTASVRDCPVGGVGLHFHDKEAAATFTEMFTFNKVSQEDGLFPAEKQLADEKRMNELIAQGDWQGLKTMVQERSSHEVYLEALAKRDSLSEKMDALKPALEESKRKAGLASPDVAIPAAEENRLLTMEYRDLYEDYAYINQLLTEHRLLTSKMAYASSTLRENIEREEGRFLSYDEKRLGDLVAMGEYPSGSPEWHAARAQGIGGSDVGGIMRVDKDYAQVNYQRVLAAKLGEELPANLQNAPTDRIDFTTAVGRGNAWEEYIRYEVQDRNPDLRVAFCKTSWHGDGEKAYRHANFDGLFLDENGQPEGILEIKTGSGGKKWGDPSEGFDGVPAGYRKQALWYAANAGLKYGKVVAVLDDNDYREYSFDMKDPAIQAEVAEMYEATDKFWNQIKEKRAEAESGLSTTHKKTNSLSTKEPVDSIAKTFASYAGIPLRDARARLREKIAEAQGPDKRELSTQEFQDVVQKTFATHDPSTRKRPMVGIDLETSSTSPRTGRILETGIVSLSNDGKRKVLLDELHGMPAKAMRGVGVGMTEVHGITPEKIKGKAAFDTPENQERILKMLKGSTLVAHNAGFEDRFLSANLPGYSEARIKGEIDLLDTRMVAKYLMPKSNDNSLQSFAEDNGVPYESAHAAAQDSIMMMESLHRLRKTMWERGRFITKRPTMKQRSGAQESSVGPEDR